jgi:signal transduction histidine kinase
MAVAHRIRTIPRMLAHCQVSRRQAAARPQLLILVLLMLSPTTPAAALPAGHEPSGAAGLWLFLSLALVLVAALAFYVGALRERARGERALQQSRQQLALQSQLQDACTWQTDAQHKLLFWQRPGQPAGSAPAGTAQIASFGAALSAKLVHQLAFKDWPWRTAAHLLSAAAPSPNRAESTGHWAIAGVPRHDEQGQFTGFVGTARAQDAQINTALQAAALLPALGAHAGAALLALNTGTGWTVQAFNPAATQRWPTLRVGASWDALLPMLKTDLPAQLLEAAAQALADPAKASASAPAVDKAAGWQFQVFAAPGAAHAGTDAGTGTGANAAVGHGLLLTQHSAGSDTGGAIDAATVHEGDTFSFTVSHDLRAPIRVVEGFTRIVKEDYGKLLDRVGNDHLDRVLGAATRMNLMIDALLTLARLSTQPLAQQPVNLSQLASYIMDDLKRGAPERQADIDIEPGLTAHGDPTLLRLVLENLLGNAWKYSGRCHRAQIALRTVPNDNAQPNAPGRPGARAFVVRDNGAGFDMRSADRLFGLFQRLHSNSDFPGHGVGLASVRRIVKRHGGDIWAEAEVGRGAAFFFTLGG